MQRRKGAINAVIRGEWIGKEVEVISAATPSLNGVKGTVVDETKNLLVLETSKGEKTLVMLGGDQVAKSGLLKKALGSRNIKLAAPEAVKATTGYEIGSIPPFHWQPEGFRSLLESSLLKETVLGVGAGKWGHEIVMSPENLIKAAKAIVIDLVPQA